ncbi:MAG TPA: tRNA-dihydrouridine synthase family protein [Planctomycetota bacterium]|nr:tRNA-dihydrouridine synthase family protein [Planctomycetota bacterium]
MPDAASIALIDRPLDLRGPGAAVRFANRLLLAPMEGVTERCFRDLVIALGGVGGACTEFVRISSSPIPARVIRRHLGDAQPVPIAVQLMAPDAEHLVTTIAAAEAAGAAWIDLNFGCPAPVVFDKCAGSALLRTPDRVAAIVRAAVAATRLPVSAKVRAGIDSPDRVAEIVLAAADAGAAMVTLHARLRVQTYAMPATWRWIAEARAALTRGGHAIPLVGNGGVEAAGDAARLMRESGCDAVMIGRAALADPWIFRAAMGGPQADAGEARAFACGYIDALAAEYGERTALARGKQLARWYRAGGLFAGREDERARVLRLDSVGAVRAWFADAAPLTGS